MWMPGSAFLGTNNLIKLTFLFTLNFDLSVLTDYFKVSHQYHNSHVLNQLT